MTTQLGLTQQLAHWIAAQHDQNLPTEVTHQVLRMMLDHVSGLVAASDSDTGKIVSQHATQYYAPGNATVIGSSSLSALGAAMVNGTNAHGIETDDGYTPGSYHPSCVIFPAVFALAEELGSSSDKILQALAVGAEVGCRIAAAGHPATRHRGFHNTAIAGVFSSAAAASLLLGLDANQTANALGIAGSHSAGLFEFLGESSEVKRFHAGKAARDGIAAAQLAQQGLTGPTTILEGPDGYFKAYAGEEGIDWLAAPVTEALGEQWFTLNTYVKPYPCCRHLHGAIDAVLHLTKEHRFAPSEIESITVSTFSIAAGHNNTHIHTIMGAQLSLPFALAVVIKDQRLTYADFGVANHNDSEIQSLMERITVEVDAAADADYPTQGRPARVKIRLKDATEVEHHVQFPYGEPQNPISDESLEKKAIQSALPFIGDAGAQQLVNAIWNFKDLNFLTELNRLLVCDRRHEAALVAPNTPAP